MASDDVPRVIVFDLDGTLWDPEMYQLNGGPPFQPSKTNPDIMIDKYKTNVHLIGETRKVLQELLTGERWQSTYLAISSTCDYPAWAEQLLNLYEFKDAREGTVSMSSLFGDLKEIYYASKAKQHETILKKVRKLDPSVTDFSQMLFFDNQRNNIQSVSAIGVACCYCPSGMTPGTFSKGLELWRKNQTSSP